MLILLFTEGIKHGCLNETVLDTKNAKEKETILVPRTLTIWGKLSESTYF